MYRNKSWIYYKDGVDRENHEKGFIYIVRHSDSKFYKIGLSKASAESRLTDLQFGNPLPLSLIYNRKVPDPFSVELFLHKVFNERIIRSEWFCLKKCHISRIIAYLESLPVTV